MSEDRLTLARQCLELVRQIAARGAICRDPHKVGYALQELTQVLVERTGTGERQFEPCSPEEIPDLERLYAELGIVSHFLESMSSSDVVTTAGGSLIQ